MADTVEQGALDDELALVDQVVSWYLGTLERDKDFLDKGKKSFEFYQGGENQWSPTDIVNAKKDDRPIVTINRIRKQVKSAIGFFTQNKLDIRPLPTDTSDHDAALSTLIYLLVKHESSPQRNNLQWQIKEAVKEGIICGRGWLVPFIDFTEDAINGEPAIEYVPWREMLKDPASKYYDLRDSTFLIRHRMLPAWEAKALWPDFKEEIGEALSRSQLPQDIVPATLREGNVVDGYAGEEISRLFRDRPTKQLLAVDCWYRVPATKLFIVTEDGNDPLPWAGTRQDFEARVEQNPDDFVGAKLQSRQSTEIRQAVVLPAIGKAVVDQESYFTQPPLDKMLPGIPFYWDSTDDGESARIEVGLVEDLKSPQEETNKRRSQFTELVGKLAGGGWLFPAAFTDEKIGKVMRRMLTPNWWVEYKTGKKPERINPPPFPQAFVQLDQMSLQDFSWIGLNPEQMGMGSGDQSGKAILLKNMAGEVQLQEPSENYAATTLMAGTWLVGMIQQTYNQKRLIHVTGDDGKRMLISLAGPTGGEKSKLSTPDGLPVLDENSQEILGEIRDFRTAKYDIVIAASPFSPTASLATMSLLQEAAQSGYPIPADLIFRFAPIPQRDLLVQALKGQKPEKPSEAVDVEASGREGRRVPQGGEEGATEGG